MHMTKCYYIVNMQDNLHENISVGFIFSNHSKIILCMVPHVLLNFTIAFRKQSQ